MKTLNYKELSLIKGGEKDQNANTHDVAEKTNASAAARHQAQHANGSCTCSNI